jgi:uncharacterized protein YqeY
MSLRIRFNEELKAAMLGKRAREVSTIRLMVAALKDKDIDARGKGNPDGLNDTEIMSMLQGMIKQRRESIDQYEKGNRPDLVAQEQEEIVIIERFLPAQMPEAEARAAIAALIGELGATSVKDMGKVMAVLKERFAGQMDFAKASAYVKEKLVA